jgi:hypothetical protein
MAVIVYRPALASSAYRGPFRSSAAGSCPVGSTPISSVTQNFAAGKGKPHITRQAPEGGFQWLGSDALARIGTHFRTLPRDLGFRPNLRWLPYPATPILAQISSGVSRVPSFSTKLYSHVPHVGLGTLNRYVSTRYQSERQHRIQIREPCRIRK